ncbi:MAG: YkgJ family cysteine cluster protein [Candidatus Pacearchaeota archaeon]|jgi:Fe-S-cluster containining protein
MKPFICKDCVQCCTEFGSTNGTGYLPVYEWELVILKDLANKNNIDLKIKPVTVLYDKISKQTFCVVYGIFNSPCIFLKNNKCSIYKSRPLVCKSYPLFWSPDYKQVITKSCFGLCPNIDHDEFLSNIKGMNKDEIKKYFKKIYGDTYKNCNQSNRINLALTDLLKGLEKDKKIFLEELYSKDYPKDIISLTEFLLNNKLVSKKELEELRKNI